MSRRKPNTTFGMQKTQAANIESARTYFDLFRNDANSISEEQYNDLNLEDLFNYSNRCITPIGAMLLYHKLRHISAGDTEVNEKIITRIETDTTFRGKIEAAFSDLADREELSTSNLLNLSINLSRWHRCFKFLPLIYLAIIGILWLFASPLAILAACLSILLFNTAIHFWNKTYVETYIRPLRQLHKIRSAAIELIKADPYNQPEKMNDSIGEINGLSKKVGVFGLNGWMESEFAAVVALLTEILKIVFLIEPIAVNTIAAKIGNVNLHAKRLIDYLGEWDVLYSIASFRAWMKQNNQNWSTPSFTASNGSLTANEMYHPLIADCVSNSIAIDKSVIITGSNMSGKSSFLKTIGVNIVAAYAMNMCFAGRMILPNCRLHTVLSVSDDINNSQSYYYTEAKRIKSIIDKCDSTPPDTTNIVLIDEIFKGTNTIERISIANAVIKYFTRFNHTIVILSTHDIELARSFKDVLNTYHFSEETAQAELQFNYQLIAGVEYTRNAISLLRSCDYPEEIISCAERNTHEICKNMDAISL